MENTFQTLGLEQYNILIGSFEESLKHTLETTQFSRLIVITDETVFAKIYKPRAILFPENTLVIQVRAGEQYKILDTCKIIWEELLRNNIDRNALCINLGGGVIGDMGGFCAATYKRGIRFIQAPTTLLSQVDASIGGKLAIDFSDVKNSIGVFVQPQAVLIDPTFLNTLSKREVLSGFAEIIKHALIDDTVLWKKLKSIESLTPQSVSEVIIPSLKVKRAIVEQDPFERNVRKALNFGHTIGHAVESYSFSTSKPLTHGEAIAIGMLCELELSHKLLQLPKEELLESKQFIDAHYPKYQVDGHKIPEIINFMRNDKKNVGDSIRFSLIEKIGTFKVDVAVETSIIEMSLRTLCS